ncbi:S41 family peptidase [Xanthomonas prunicola]|uniref:Peptidase S41 n=1 Tax=Xanthomonas prunicola TaxID=2053930 RepID=A0A2N3REF4_9XANT|nr:S41 family peptidase [Xanthomonas prunicola]PKV10877.1 peptidase S41 [Xanthomonas prunicola]PKV15210.1 peptidase S41 [Xanthomonas prunicola]PKV19912.1 peptidase S41 [Xanthomonas prunicola]
MSPRIRPLPSLLWLLLLWPLCVAPAASSAPLLTSDSRLAGPALLADVDVLQHAYEALHPGLYRYATEQQVAQRFDALRTELGHGATLGQAYLAISRLTASVRCGHSFPNFVNQPEPIQHALFPGERLLPFHFRWLHGRMVVSRNGSDQPDLRPGTEVLSIDGVATAQILAALMTVARADGGNDAKRIAQMEVQGFARIEAFDVYLPLLFPQMSADPVLQVRTPGATAQRTLRVHGIGAAQRNAMAPQRARDSAAPAWTLTMDSADLAILRMPDWALYDSPWDWQAFLAHNFARLAERQVPALVIDLRGNEGGLNVGSVLLGYLGASEVAVSPMRQLVRYRRLPDALAPYVTTWDRSFRDWGARAVAYDTRFYTLDPPHTAAQRYLPLRAPHFNGRVFVLTSAENSSATFEFAQQLQRNGLATLVGQPTGGNLRGINGSAFFFLHLPNSQIEVDLPLVAQLPTSAQPDRGVLPDVPVDITAQDLQHGRDVEMDAVRALLRSDGTPQKAHHDAPA